MKLISFAEIAGGYFNALGIPLAAGGTFAARDAGRDLAIVNETAARMYWPGQSPIGKTMLSNGKVFEVIGVAKDGYTIM